MKISNKQASAIVERIHDEMGDETLVNITVRRKIPKTEDFVMIYQKIGKMILEDKMSLSGIKVFFYLIVNLEYQNFIGIDLKTISDKIDMPYPTVKKAMKELKDANILLATKDTFDARRNIYRLNPLAAWKGKVRNRVKAIQENPNQLTLYSERNT